MLLHCPSWLEKILEFTKITFYWKFHFPAFQAAIIQKRIVFPAYPAQNYFCFNPVKYAYKIIIIIKQQFQIFKLKFNLKMLKFEFLH